MKHKPSSLPDLPSCLHITPAGGWEPSPSSPSPTQRDLRSHTLLQFQLRIPTAPQASGPAPLTGSATQSSQGLKTAPKASGFLAPASPHQEALRGALRVPSGSPPGRPPRPPQCPRPGRPDPSQHASHTHPMPRAQATPPERTNRSNPRAKSK